MQVKFSSVGSTEVGQSLNITCTVMVAERLAVPNITVTKINETVNMLSDLTAPYIISTDDTADSMTRILTLTFDPVRFEDGAMYTCMAEFNVTGLNGTDDPNTATYDFQECYDTFNLTVECKLLITS